MIAHPWEKTFCLPETHSEHHCCLVVLAHVCTQCGIGNSYEESVNAEIFILINSSTAAHEVVCTHVTLVQDIGTVL